METRNCPICYQKHNTLARYKNAVCNACLTSYGTRDRNGNNKEFYNIDIWGGIKCIINEKEAIIVTSDFHLNRAKFIFKKIFGPKYRLKFIATPSGFENDKLLKERQKYLLEKTKEFLKEMKEGDHNFLKGKLYKSKFYKEIAPKEIEKFVKTGRL